MKNRESPVVPDLSPPSRGRQPIYLVLARTLMSEIQRGHYPVGAQLPTEAELQKRFSVSRHTVRESVRELQQQGYVTTMHGIGTVVRARSSESHLMQRSASFEDLAEFTKATRMRVVGQREFVAEAMHVGVLHCPVGQAWLEVEALRFGSDGDTPIGFLSTYLRPEFADVIPAIDSSRRPIFALVEELHGVQVVEMDQEIESVPLPRHVAILLDAPTDGHGLQIARRHRDAQGRLTQVTIAIYPEGRLVHSSRIRIDRGA